MERVTFRDDKFSRNKTIVSRNVLIFQLFHVFLLASACSRRNNPVEVPMLFANQKRHTLDVVSQVQQTNLNLRPCASNGADANAAHLVGHRPKDMLHS